MTTPAGSETVLELRWRQKKGQRLLFLIHGYAEHPAAALMMGTLLDPEQSFRLCAPSGSLDLGDDRRTFYLVDFRARVMEPASFAAALVAINAALDEACEVSGTRREDAVLAGFSQGGGLALATALRANERPPPAAVMVFSGMFYGDDDVDWDLGQSSRPSIFWAHGTRDETFGIDRHRTAVARLTRNGIDVAAHEVDAAHVLTPTALALGRDWLAAYTGQNRPAHLSSGKS